MPSIMHLDMLGSLFFFLKENGGAMTIGEGNSGRSGGRGDCRGKVLYERRINIKEKEEI